MPGPPHQFTLHDGTELAHDNVNGGLTLSSTAGTVFPESRQYEVFGVATEPTDVRYDDAALTKSESLDALSTSEDGWFYDESQKTVFIRAPGTANVTVLGLED